MRIVGIVVSLICLAAATALGRQLEARAEQQRLEGGGLVYLPPGALLKHATFGHRHVGADYVWLQALQYYGNEANRAQRYGDLHRFIDLVNELDPDFHYAYRFGAAAVPYNSGNWTWHNVDASTRIAERGLKRFHDDWQLWLQLGFNKGILGNDLAGAAEAYGQAARVPGAPTWIPQLVTRLYATAGALDRAEAYARQIVDGTDQPELQEAMRVRLKEIEVERTLIHLDEAIRRWVKERGAPPSSVYELVAAGYLTRMPWDPLGGGYYIENGEARSTSLHKGRLRVFNEDRSRSAW